MILLPLYEMWGKGWEPPTGGEERKKALSGLTC